MKGVPGEIDWGGGSFLMGGLCRGGIQTWAGLNPLRFSKNRVFTERRNGDFRTPICFSTSQTQGKLVPLHSLIIHDSRVWSTSSYVWNGAGKSEGLPNRYKRICDWGGTI